MIAEAKSIRVVNCEQYSQEWWSVRCSMPTASEFHRIITPAKWEFASGAATYAMELIAQKYDYNYGMHEGYVSAAMRNGTIMEPEARRYYEFELGVEVQRVGFVISECGRWGASPDSLVGDDGGTEIKHPTAATHIKWLLAGVVPPEHLAQCHGSLLITKRKWWDFLSYYPGLPPLIVRVTPDEKTVALAEALEKFWVMLTEMRTKIEAQGNPMAVASGAEQQAYF